MKISPLNIFSRVQTNGQTSPLHSSARFSPNLLSLKQDTVSFKGAKTEVKKSQFKGLDFATVERYKVDINKFNCTGDLQDWAREKIQKDFVEKDFGGRQEETQIQRKAMLKEWIDYVTKENDAYTPVMQLAILDAMTKGFKPNNDTLPPVLNKGVLADTMAVVVKALDKKPKEHWNINKIYQTKLNNLYFGEDEEGKANSDFTGWIVIPSQKNDPAHFDKNVDKLKTLSHDNWCTKSFNAESYLSGGDFHVYLENGKPKLGVRFLGNYIREIQGELNNSKIPVKYYDTVKQHIEQGKYSLESTAKEEIRTAEKVKEKLNKIKAELGEEAIKNSEPEVIFPYFQIDVKKDNDGKLIISNFKQPSFEYTFDDLGINEEKLLHNMKKVESNCNLADSTVLNLENLEEVGGNLYCSERKNVNLKNLKKIGNYTNFEDAKNINLDSLEEIGTAAVFSRVQGVELPKLKKIGEEAYFSKAKIKNLDALESCGYLDIQDSDIESMKNLEVVRGHFNFNNKISNLDKLRRVESIIRGIFRSNIERLPSLEYVGDDLDLNGTKITDLNNLKKVEGNFRVGEKITSLEKLETVTGNLDLGKTKIKALPNLKTVGGYLSVMEGSEIEDMGNLEKVDGDLFASNTKLKDLHSLRTVGGSLYLNNTLVEDLGSLVAVMGGNCEIMYSPVKKLDKLESVANRLRISNSKVRTLDSLRFVGGFFDAMDSELESAKALRDIHGGVYFNKNTAMTDEGLPSLGYVSGEEFVLGKNMTKDAFKKCFFTGTFYNDNLEPLK